MRTCHTTWLLALSAAVIAACGGDDGGGPVDARPIDAPSCTPVDDNNECTTDECVAGQPVNTPRDGASCTGGGTCDASGTCVPAASCTDNMMNGTETGVDCGGSCAPARTCDTGAGCTVPGDCTSGVCSGTPMTCQAPSCGDGVMQAGEMCDDGNNMNGDGCDDGAGDACRPTGCGNGVQTGTEACDDGNAMNGDGCDNNCTVTGCGNGVTTGTETCDDGDTMDGDGCSAACAPEAGYTCTAAVPSVCSATCGDGIIAVGAETCDQGMGNQTPGDGCSAACAVEAGWACTGAVSTCAPVCGDGMIIAPETCDDSNTVNFDNCSSLCRTELSEVEPNEDGTPSTGGSSTNGNDFDTATAPAISVAAMNANTQGAILASGGSVNRLGALSVGAAPGTGGDEDAWAITNDTAARVEVTVDVWNRATGFGLGVACGTSIDTGLNIRTAQGAILASNDDRNGSADRCSSVSFVLAANTTVYAHVVDFGDTDVIPGYGLQVQVRAIVCGDNRQVPTAEECDDGNTAASDGCSATCTIEGTTEVEPNEDGTPATGGSGIVGNDFDVGGMLAINNATAQGVVDVATGGRTWLAALSVGAAPGTAGDEDVFALTNGGAGAFEVQVDTWDPTRGINQPCVATSVDTGINVRDAAGAVVASNNDRVSGDGCSRVTFVMATGTTRYVHVTENGDNAVVGRYVAQVTRRAIVCGDTTQTPGVEECDDGNTMPNDGCSATCQVEGTNELEPNEDGTPATGGTSIGGNDFTAASAATVVANATAQGVADLSTGGRTWLAALRVGAAPGTAGDEDVFAVTNTGAAGVVVTAETNDLTLGVGRPCVVDTGINVRDAAGAVVTSNDDTTGLGACSRVTFGLAPGATRYIHVTEYNDDATIARYALRVTRRVAVCGDSTREAGLEACDDGNTMPGDGCSATCTQEAGYTCNTASPTVCTLNPFQSIPLACTDMTAATALATPPDNDEGVSANTALPFTVPMYGSNMVSFSASANGVMQLFTTASGTSTATFSNPSTVPSTSSPNGWLAPFWDDLDLATVTTLTTGTAPNRRFTVQWSATIYLVSGSNVRFQAQFVEGGPIEFHYCSATGDAARTTGSSATVGVENAAGTTGFAVGINTANTVTPGTTALRWTIP